MLPILRAAEAADLPRIVDLLVHDSLGKQREIEGPLRDCYRHAFAIIDAAHRFYERLGFVASHEGMKLHLI